MFCLFFSPNTTLGPNLLCAMRKASVNEFYSFVSFVSMESGLRVENFLHFWSHCITLITFLFQFILLSQVLQIPKFVPWTIRFFKFLRTCDLAKHTAKTRCKRFSHIWSCCLVQQWRSENALLVSKIRSLMNYDVTFEIWRFLLSFGNYWSVLKTIGNKIEKTF